MKSIIKLNLWFIVCKLGIVIYSCSVYSLCIEMK